MNTKTIDIVLPCFNPAAGWSVHIVNAMLKLQSLDSSFKWNLILVNDGSRHGISDQDISFLEQKLDDFKYISYENNLGKGAALKNGFELSENDWSVFTDVDFPYDEENIIAMLHQLESGADIVLGIRNKQYYQKVPLVRSLLSSSFKRLIKVVFSIPTTDTQAGLKAFSAKGKEMILKTETNRYLFDLELIKRSAKAKLNFAYVDLNLKDNVVLSKLSLKVLFGEIINLFKIFLL